MLDRIPNEQLALRRNTFAVVRRLFRWAVSRGDLERSPCDAIETPPPVAPRDRILTDSELVRVWSASYAAGKLFGPIVRLLIATGQRREEVSGLAWSELDQAASLWTLPKERAKNGVAHTIPLNSLALEILTERADGSSWPTEGLVFKTSGGKRFIGHSKGKLKIDELIANDGSALLAPWRLHDLRRTLATGFQRLGIRFEVTEAVLNHLSGSRAGVAGVYQRHDWKEEKAQALSAWAEHLRTVLSDPKPQNKA